MAGRPNRNDSLARKGKIAVEQVREELPTISRQLLEAAKGGKRTVVCQKCKHPNVVEWVGDPNLAKWLWERVEGRPPDQKPPSETEKLIDFFSRILDKQHPPA